MKNVRLIFLIVAGAVVSAVIVFFTFDKKNVFNKNTTSSDQTILSSQTNSEGLVTVRVTPKDLLQSSPTWDFEIVLDTHSGNLDQDLTKIAVLIDDKGDRFSPAAWEGEPPQEHHRQEVLKFKPISPRPTSVELKISRIGDVDDRSFKWKL